MGINVRLEHERGSAIQEILELEGNVNLLVRTLREDAGSKCVAFVDPYGNTTFNQLQLPVLVAELGEAISLAPASVRPVGEQLVQLAEKALASPHLYIRFVGD